MSELSRIRWKCRRGMRELDALFDAFLNKGMYDKLSDDEKRKFEKLLDVEDDQLFDHFLGRTEPEDPEVREMMAVVKTVHDK